MATDESVHNKSVQLMAAVEPRPGHPYYMYDAICEQPDALRRTLERNHVAAAELARELAAAPALRLAGIGTSLNAALYGAYWMRAVGGLMRVNALSSFDLANYFPPLPPDSALITLSHRGWKQFSARAVTDARARGVLTAAICGEGPNEGARLADHLFITTEQEKSGAHTKSLTSAMALLFDLALEIRAVAHGNDEIAVAMRREFPAIPSRLEQRIADDSRERAAAERLSRYSSIIITGAGPNYITAREIALKLKEAAYVHAEALQIEEFLHGPIAAVDADTLVILISAAAGAGADRALQAARALGELGAARLALVVAGAPAPAAEVTIPVAASSETLSPFGLLLSLQLFTYYFALARGCDPDRNHRQDPRHAQAATHYDL
ncbi:MAG: SIS domain-containing protein [Candidatus Binataceae bacterium]